MRKWFARLIVEGVSEKCFYFYTPLVGQPGFYRQTVSISCFRERELKRRFPMEVRNGKVIRALLPKNGVKGMRWTSMEMLLPGEEGLCSAHKLALEMGKPITVIEDGVWEFYKAIGYDHKKQRYLAAA